MLLTLPSFLVPQSFLPLHPPPSSLVIPLLLRVPCALLQLFGAPLSATRAVHLASTGSDHEAASERDRSGMKRRASESPGSPSSLANDDLARGSNRGHSKVARWSGVGGGGGDCSTVTTNGNAPVTSEGVPVKADGPSRGVSDSGNHTGPGALRSPDSSCVVQGNGASDGDRTSAVNGRAPHSTQHLHSSDSNPGSGNSNSRSSTPSLTKIRGSMEETLVSAIKAKVEGKRREIEEMQRKLAGVEASAAYRKQAKAERSTAVEEKKRGVEGEVDMAVRKAEELEARARVARKKANDLLEGKEGRIRALQEEHEREEEVARREAEEEERKRDEMKAWLKDGEEKLKEMEIEMEAMVGKVKEMMSNMVMQLDSWGK